MPGHIKALLQLSRDTVQQGVFEMVMSPLDAKPFEISHFHY